MKKTPAAILFCMIGFSLNLLAKDAVLSITGPACAIAGGTNGVVYFISGKTQPDDNIVWQITGGSIVGSGKNTVSGTMTGLGSQIRVIWTAGIKEGIIQVNSSRLGKAQLRVSVVTIVNQITSAALYAVRNNSFTITGFGPDNSCSANYAYWWEAADSVDGPFIPIEGAGFRDLSLDSLNKSRFYRRVINANGDNIYSNILFIPVKNQVSWFRSCDHPQRGLKRRLISFEDNRHTA
jgi:hypothetical protein